jgi:hypothetical protein
MNRSYGTYIGVTYFINGLKSVATKHIVPLELTLGRAVGPKHIVGMDFNPSLFINTRIKEP